MFDCFNSTARWSDEKVCTGHNSAHKIYWKYRVSSLITLVKLLFSLINALIKVVPHSRV